MDDKTREMNEHSGRQMADLIINWMAKILKTNQNK